ncbi:MAG: DUF3780 domain-containing protein [Lysobacteraceae bacterium]
MTSTSEPGSQTKMFQNPSDLIESQGESDPEKKRAILPLDVWKKVAEFVRRDFNERLRAQGKKAGEWKVAGEVLMDRLLDRELALLWWSLEGLAAKDDAAIGAALKSWQGLRPEERWWLASLVACSAGNVEGGQLGWRRAIRAAMVEGSLPPGALAATCHRAA